MLIYARVTVNTDSTHEMVLSMLKRKIGSGGGTRAFLRYVFVCFVSLSEEVFVSSPKIEIGV